MWSASMFVTTASTGVRYRNDASDSSASATRKSPLPSRAFASADEQAPADDERRIEAAFGEHRRDQARRRRLAVRAGDGDALLQPHQLGEHQRARHDRDAALARREHFGIVGRPPRSTRRRRRRRAHSRRDGRSRRRRRARAGGASPRFRRDPSRTPGSAASRAPRRCRSCRRRRCRRSARA